MNKAIISPARQSREVSEVSDLDTRRLMRLHRRVGTCLDRNDIAGAQRAIFEYRSSIGTPETRLEYFTDLVQSLLDCSPYLHPDEPEFLADMARRLSRGQEPSERQAAWIDKIARRRRA